MAPPTASGADNAIHNYCQYLQVVFAPPVAAGDLCTALVSVAVPLAAPDQQGEKILRFAVSATPEPGRSNTRRDRDRLKLVCTPADAP